MDGIVNLQHYGFVLFYTISKTKCNIMFRLDHFLPHRTYAIHIHEYGDMSDGCTSLGGHYNPEHKKHGSLETSNRHKGDLMNNFTTDSSGSFHHEQKGMDLSMDDLFGRSIVIHEYHDDLGRKRNKEDIPYSELSYKELTRLCQERGYTNVRTKQEKIAKLIQESYITGNAGKRLLCGIIGRIKKNKILHGKKNVF